MIGIFLFSVSILPPTCNGMLLSIIIDFFVSLQTSGASAQDEDVFWRGRSYSCPSRPSFEREEAAERGIEEERVPTISEDDENDVDEVDINAVNFDGSSIVESATTSIPLALLKESRTSPYPASGLSRFPVPDCYVSWTVSSMLLSFFHSYNVQRPAFSPRRKCFILEGFLQSYGFQIEISDALYWYYLTMPSIL